MAITKREYRKQTDLAAEIVRELPLPEGAEVVVPGDTAFDAEVIRTACAERNYSRIVPMNPERVLAGPKPRPKVSSLAKQLTTGQFRAIRLYPNKGERVAMRRLSAYRVGPKVKPRVDYAHSEIRDVHSEGKVRLVFSTKEKPSAQQAPVVQKILLSNSLHPSAAEVVE